MSKLDQPFHTGITHLHNPTGIKIKNTALNELRRQLIPSTSVIGERVFEIDSNIRRVVIALLIEEDVKSILPQDHSTELHDLRIEVLSLWDEYYSLINTKSTSKSERIMRETVVKTVEIIRALAREIVSQCISMPEGIWHERALEPLKQITLDLLTHKRELHAAILWRLLSKASFELDGKKVIVKVSSKDLIREKELGQVLEALRDDDEIAELSEQTWNNLLIPTYIENLTITSTKVPESEISISLSLPYSAYFETFVCMVRWLNWAEAKLREFQET